MKLLPRLCMATSNAAAGDSDGSSNKLGSTASSSSSTVSSSSSSAAAATVSEASSSTSIPSLPTLSAATSNASSITASFTHLATLLPLPTAAITASSAAAVAPAADSFHGFIVARPASVALHGIFTLEATSTSSPEDDATTAGSVKCVAHVHGGKAVTGHQDGRLRLWRASSRAPSRIRLAAELPTVTDRLRRFPVPSNHIPIRRHHRRLWIEHADAVSGVAASADGRLLFSVSWDRTLKVWAVPSLRCLQSLPAHDDAVNAVAAAPDGTVYTGSADTRVRVWAPRPAGSDKSKVDKSKNPAVYYLVATLSRHKAAVNAVAVGCGGQMLYSAGNDRCVVVWEREDSASHMVAIGALRGHRKAVLSVACAGNDDGALVVSGSADQTVRAWRREADGRGHTCVAIIDGHGSAVRSVSLAPFPEQKRRPGENGDGDEEWRLCSASFDGEVRVWSLRVTMGL